MNFGLSEKELEEIISVFQRFPGIKKVMVFGSRAMGCHQKRSDVDMALQGDITFDVVVRVKSVLEQETRLPYFFDIVDYDSITNPDLKKHIDEQGKVLFKQGRV
mgnify:CR=1 FL=1